MIDETLLADPTRCPDCAAVLTPARDVCPACRLPLSGAVAGRLWQVSVQAAELLRTRAELVAHLRSSAYAPAVAAATGPAAGPTAPPAPAVPVAPRPEWTRRQVQNLLLALGVGLLGVAAVIFVAVSWERLGVGGRSAVMGGVTAVAATAAAWTFRRGLVSTAEWLSALTVGLAVLDGYGARSADLAGLADAGAAAYWAGALAVVAALTGLLAVVVPTRTLPVAAAVLGQLPVPLLCAHLSARVDQPAALVAVLLTAQAVADLGAVAAWPAAGRTAAARGVLAVGGVVTHLAAAFYAGAAAYAEDGSLVVGTGVLLALAAVPVVAGTVLSADVRADERRLADGYAALLVVAAVWAPAVELVAQRWQPPVLGALAVGLLAATLLVPARRRAAVAWVALTAGLLPGLWTLEVLEGAAEAVLLPLEQPWRVAAADAAVAAGAPSVLVLAAAGAALVLGSSLLRRPAVGAAGLPVLTVAAALVAPALEAPFATQLAVLAVLGVVLLVAGARLDARGRLLLAWTALASGAAALVAATGWSFAEAEVCLVALPGVAAGLLVGALAARASEALRPWRVLLVAVALLVGIVEAAGLARYDGAGWAAVWSLALALLAGTATTVCLGLSLRTAVRDGFWAPLHTASAAVAAGAAVAAAATTAAWQGTAPAGCGLAASCAAAVLLAASAAPWRTGRSVRGAMQVTAALAAVPALLLAALDAERLWVALLVVGLGVALVATTPARHRLGWVAGAVLAASSWVRLLLSDVDAPEAYTVPGAVALLVVGVVRRRRDPTYGSWQAYGTGLSLALVPSLLRAVTDVGDLRPLLLAVVAAGVVGVGALRRLQAPLVLGAGVLALDALVQLAPYLAAAYEVVPRWVTIGSLGLLLLGAGATYEQRVRDLRRVGRHVARLG